MLIRGNLFDFFDRNAPRAHLSTFEFGGHANLGCLTLLDIKTSLDGPIHLQGGLSMEICCINVQQSLQICLQSSKIRPPNSNIDKCVFVVVKTTFVFEKEEKEEEVLQKKK